MGCWQSMVLPRLLGSCLQLWYPGCRCYGHTEGRWNVCSYPMNDGSFGFRLLRFHWLQWSQRNYTDISIFTASPALWLVPSLSTLPPSCATPSLSLPRTTSSSHATWQTLAPRLPRDSVTWTTGSTSHPLETLFCLCLCLQASCNHNYWPGLFFRWGGREKQLAEQAAKGGAAAEAGA